MATDVSMKVPPHDSDAEKAVLGSMLQTQDAITEATAVLTEQDFYEPKNQIIFSTIIRLFSAGEPADVITVANQLEKEDKLTQAGGSIYIADLVPSSPQAASVNSYASIVRDKALLRRVIEPSSKWAKKRAAHQQNKSSTWPSRRQCPYRITACAPTMWIFTTRRTRRSPIFLLFKAARSSKA